MRAIFTCRKPVIFPLILMLSGCEAWQVLTFQGSSASGYAEGELSVEVISDQPISNTAKSSPRSDDYSSYCIAAPEMNFVAALVPVVVEVATLAVDHSSQAIQSWLNKKKALFQTAEKTSVNLDAFAIKDANKKTFVPTPKCLVVKQTVKDKGAGGKMLPGFVFAALLLTDQQNKAFRLYPTFYELDRATALTGSSSPKLDISIKFTFNVIGPGETGAAKNAGLGVAQIDLKAVVLPPQGSDAIKHSATDVGETRVPLDNRLGRSGESGWLPIVSSDSSATKCLADPSCTGLEPATIAVEVDETGTGSEAFGTVSKDVSDNTKAVETAITQAVQSALKSAAPSTAGTGSKSK